jgi:threonine dehydratase
MIPTLDQVREAKASFPSWIQHTRLLPVHIPGCEAQCYVKTECLQRTGAFKVRGAYNKMRTLTEKERKSGVLASSAGNHAQGVALAAREMGIKATIVMPRFAPLSKVNATRALGAEVILHGEVYDDAYAYARELEKKTGATFIHPYDDTMVIAGQGTIALEILEDLPDTDVILVPVGGGGLAAGVAMAAKSINPLIRVYGVEPVGAASMKRAFQVGHPESLGSVKSFADGVTVCKVGEISCQVCQKYLDGILTVDDDETAAAILWMIEKHKIVMEGAGALPVAALMHGSLDLSGKKVVAVASGGNIDVNTISRIIERGLIKSGRRVTLATTVLDRPGQLARLINAVAAMEVNVLSINHDRNRSRLELGEAQVELVLETNDRSQIDEVKENLGKMGLKMDEID